MINNNSKESLVYYSRRNSISETNKNCLMNRVSEIALKLMEKETENHYSKFFIDYHYNDVKEKYDSEIINKTIDFFNNKPVTSLVLPYLSAFTEESMDLPVAVALVMTLYSRLLASKYSLENLPSPDELIHYDGCKQSFIDSMGKVIDENDFSKLQLLIQELTLITKILTSENTHNVFLGVIPPSKKYHSLSEEEKLSLGREFDEMKASLIRNDLSDQSKTILPGLKKLIYYSQQPINLTKLKNDQTLHSVNKNKIEQDLILKKTKKENKLILDSINNEVDAIWKKVTINNQSSSYFDDKTCSFYTPSNSIINWWCYQTPDIITKKVSTLMNPEISTKCDSIKKLLNNLTEISKKDIQILNSKFNAIEESLILFTDELSKSDELLKATISLRRIITACLDEAKTKLQRMSLPVSKSLPTQKYISISRKRKLNTTR